MHLVRIMMMGTALPTRNSRHRDKPTGSIHGFHQIRRLKYDGLAKKEPMAKQKGRYTRRGVCFANEAIQMVCRMNKTATQRSRSDFLRRHQVWSEQKSPYQARQLPFTHARQHFAYNLTAATIPRQE